MFPTKTKILSILVLIPLFIAAGAAWAQTSPSSIKVPMPEIELMPEEEFIEKTKVIEEVPFGDEALAYKIRLPKDWSKLDDSASSNFTLGSKVLGEITRFYSPVRLGLRSYFSLEVVELSFKSSAEQWLYSYLLSNGFAVQGIKVHSADRVEALYVNVVNGETYVSRIVAQINGKRVLLANFVIPVAYWESDQKFQAQAISSFEIMNKVEEDIEELTQYHFLDVAEFKYPRSWELEAGPLRTIDSMTLKLYNIASEKVVKRQRYRTLNGQIEIRATSYYTSDGLEQESDSYMSSLTDLGFSVTGLIEEQPEGYKFHEDVEDFDFKIYKAHDPENSMIEHELWLAVLEAGEYYYTFALLTPSREDDYFVWVRNTETFRLVLEKFAPF